MADHANRHARSPAGGEDRAKHGGPERVPGKRTLVESEAEAETAPQASTVPGRGAALPGDLQARFEASLGGSLDHVRVHADDPSAPAMGARAYARGSDLHFAPGEYEPSSQRGQALIGHELVHTVQQAQGRVATSVQTKGIALNHDDGLEAEADELGARIAAGQRVELGAVGPAPAGGPVQRYLYLGADGTDRVKAYEHLPPEYQKEIANHVRYKEVEAFVREHLTEAHLYLRAFTPQHLIQKFEEHKPARLLGPESFSPGDKLYGLTGSYGNSTHNETMRDQHAKNLASNQATAAQGNTSNTIDGHLFGLRAETGGPLNIPSDGSERERFGQFLDEDPENRRGSKGGKAVASSDKVTRKVCKAGIEFFTGRENKVIHFELFGLDMTRTVTSGTSYTDSELRYIYRQYLEHLAGQAVANLDNIRFYLDGNPMPPPWIAEPELWAKYKLARDKKQMTKATSTTTKPGNSNNKTDDDGKDDDGKDDEEGWDF